MTRRTLADWLGYLETLHPSAIDMGLDRVRQVAMRLGLGRPAPRVMTVTGTNGKGSTCAFLAALLRAQGLRIGVYASPHLQRYNERVTIDGVPASDDALCDAFEEVEGARGDTSLTYFEMGTLAAFRLFERAGLDAVVLEVGLGGRLDAVNLVDADVAVVTNIGLDHAEWLGDTRDSVATEKAGIFRAGRPALCGDPSPPSALAARAEAIGAPLWQRGRDYAFTATPTGWSWQGCDAQGVGRALEGLPPLRLPVQNAALALQAYALLGLPWQPERIGPALAATRVAGRLDARQVRRGERTLHLLLDVGHNPHAAVYLASRLAEQPPVGRRLAVFGLLSDKDLDGVLAPLLPVIDRWAVCTLDSHRARPGVELLHALEARGAEAEDCGTVAAALDAVCEQATEHDEILVFGSFYCVAEALDWLDRHGGGTRDGVAG